MSARRNHRIKKVSSFIVFREAGTSKTGITRVWNVVNIMREQEDPIGIIRWHGAWRKYVYECAESFYDYDCLRLIADFVEGATKGHFKGGFWPFTGEYEKQFYDVRLANGPVYEHKWPNAGMFWIEELDYHVEVKDNIEIRVSKEQ